MSLGSRLLLAIALLGCESEPTSEPDGGPTAASLCEGERCVYVVGALHVPRDEEGPVPGIDLDGRVSDEADEAGCLKPDFVAPDGREGIDNRFATMVSTLEEALGESIDGPLREAIASGELLLAVELSDGESGTELELGPAAVVNATGEPALDPSGDIASGQSFERTEPPHVGRASIREGVVEAPVGDVLVALPLDATTTIDFPMREARLRVPFVDGRPTTGALAGRLYVDDLITMGPPPIGPGVDDSLVRTTLEGQADLDPNDEGVCQSISIAFAVHLVPAQLAP